MSRLLSLLTKRDRKSFYCEQCLHRFYNENLPNEHIIYCKEDTSQHIKMSEVEDHILKFDKIALPYSTLCIIFTDF